MRVLIIAILAAISYAQTGFDDFKKEVKQLEGKDFPGFIWEIRDFNGDLIDTDSSGVLNSKGLPPGVDVPVRLYSMTKAIVATTAAKLVELGTLDWDAKPSDYIIELQGKEWKLVDKETIVREPTIAELCSHSSGSFYALLDEDESKHPDASQMQLLTETKSWGQFVHSLGLLFEPGTQFAYSHGLDFIGEIISKIEGRSLGEVMKDYIFEPLGMESTTFTLPESRRERSAEIWTSEDVAKAFDGEKGFGNSEPIKEFMRNLDGAPREMGSTSHFDSYTQAGGHGLWGTLEDYRKFVGMLANLGKGLNGARVLDIPNAAKLIYPIVHDVLLDVPAFGLGEAHNLRHSKLAAIDNYNKIVHWVGIASTQFIIDFKNRHFFLFFSQSWNFPSWLKLYDLYVKNSGGIVQPGVNGKAKPTTKEEL